MYDVGALIIIYCQYNNNYNRSVHTSIIEMHVGIVN